MGQNGARGRSIGPRSDPRFALHQRQPRADKLDARQRRLCQADHAFLEALRARVASPTRFAAFLDGIPTYIDLERSCAKCGSFKKRVRDRSCYACHLDRGGDNFERMKAGLAPKTNRSLAGHLDLLERRRREQNGEVMECKFGDLVAHRWPMGRLAVTFPDGYVEPDMSKLLEHEMRNAISEYPAIGDILVWAGWTVPG